MKHNLELEEIIERINKGLTFEAELSDGSAYIKIDGYVPFACFAIHNGHRLRKSLLDKSLLSDYERWYEEDPHTLDFISSMPIVIAGNDSRYEYDLNRGPDQAIYFEEAWGKKLWKEPLTSEDLKLSLEKHSRFYKIVDALVLKLEKLFGAVVVFDVHSFNYKRLKNDAPVFNIGTELIDRDRYGKQISYYIRELEKVKLPSIDITVEENDVFYGKGYLLAHITEAFGNTLVLATEIKKIYCDEETGESYPVVVEQLSTYLKGAILNTTAYFSRRFTTLRLNKKNKLLTSELDRDLISVDKKLYLLVRNFEILSHINPINIEQARKDFIRSKYTRNPEFKYRQLIFNPFEFKRELYNLPIEKIKDISIKLLIQDIIDSYSAKLDIIAAIGTDKLMYNSLRYYGEPSARDIKNAGYLLHLSSEADGKERFNLTARDAYDFFRRTIDTYGFQCKIEITNKTVSQVLILNTKRTIRIRKDAHFSSVQLRALAEHEVGVHMLTTVNAAMQPLKLFWLGTPVNTQTQEGLAILSEYLSGNLTIHRLKTLALRVLAIEKLLEGFDFVQTYHYIKDISDLNDTQAFYLTARIYRGGGFTKDHLYLRGFRKILKMHREHHNLTNLLVGKTSAKYLGTINEMIERKMITPPKYKTHALMHPVKADPIIDYILKGL